MAKWTRRPQECAGDYFFSGRAHMTRTVAEEVPTEEFLSIIADLKDFVRKNDGIDYIVVYECSDTGKKIFCIDQLSKTMKENGDYTAEQIREYDCWTMMFAEEY